jgi:hypothetical protein
MRIRMATSTSRLPRLQWIVPTVSWFCILTWKLWFAGPGVGSGMSLCGLGSCFLKPVTERLKGRAKVNGSGHGCALPRPYQRCSRQLLSRRSVYSTFIALDTDVRLVMVLLTHNVLSIGSSTV